MYIPLSDDKYQMARDSSKKCTGQRRHNSNPVATLPHAVVFRMQPFNFNSVFLADITVNITQKQSVRYTCYK